MSERGDRVPGVSLIVTVRDDREGLRDLLEALAQQTEMPDELVVVDGGSQDGTLEELERWDQGRVPLRVIVSSGANIAAGRNVAVREASHDWIVCTDAGCRPVPEWFSVLKAARERQADVVAGTFVVEGDTAFDRALACTHYPVLEELQDPSGLVALSHRVFGRDFRAQHAGGRSMAFSRAAWEAAGGFPEYVHAGEDLAFSAAAIESGFEAMLAEDAVVRWRPRSTWLDNARMFATYTRGDIRTRGRGRHLARLVAWGGGLALVVWGGWIGRALVFAGALTYLWLPLHRARRRGLPLREWWRIPALVALKDLSQLAGAARGIIDAIRGVPQPAPARRG
jgi:glycosyltransferase involved in cell wall biosynthesis